MNEKRGGFGNRKPQGATPTGGASPQGDSTPGTPPPPDTRPAFDRPDTDGADAADEEELIRLFVGENFGKFEAVYEKMKIKKGALGWCWTAFFLPSVWLLYRKLYIEAVVILVLPVVILTIFPNLDIANVGISVAVAMTGKNYYLGRAKTKIGKIMALSEPDDFKMELLQRAGGVSWPAAIIGIAIYASLIGLALWAVFGAA